MRRMGATKASGLIAGIVLFMMPSAMATLLPGAYNRLWNTYAQVCYDNTSVYVVSPNAAWGNPTSGKSIILSGDSQSADIDYSEGNNYQQCISALDSFDTARQGGGKARVVEQGQEGSRSTPRFMKLVNMVKNTRDWEPINPLSSFVFSSQIVVGGNRYTGVGEYAIEYCLNDNCAWTVPLVCYNLYDILNYRYNGDTTAASTPAACYTVYDVWSTTYSAQSVPCNPGNQSYMKQAPPSTVWAASQQQAGEELITTVAQTAINGLNISKGQAVWWQPATNSTQSNQFESNRLQMAMPMSGNITVNDLSRAAYSKISNGDTNRALGYISIHGGGCVKDACALTTSGKLASMVYGCDTTYGTHPPSMLVHYMDVANYVLIEWFSAECGKLATASISSVTLRELKAQGKDYCSTVVQLYDMVERLSIAIANAGTCKQIYDVDLLQSVNASAFKQAATLPQLWDSGPFLIDDDQFDSKIFEIKNLTKDRPSACFSNVDAHNTEHNIDQYTLANTGRTVHKPMLDYAVGSLQGNLLSDHIIDIIRGSIVANKPDIISDLLTTANKRYKGATYTENILALISTATVLAAMVSVDQYQLAQRNLARIGCSQSSWKCYITAGTLIALMAAAAAGASIATLANNIVAANDETINFTELPVTGMLNTGNGTGVYMYGTNQIYMDYKPPNYEFSVWWSAALIVIVGFTTIVRTAAMLLDSKNRYRKLTNDGGSGILVGAGGVQLTNVATTQ